MANHNRTTSKTVESVLRQQGGFIKEDPSKGNAIAKLIELVIAAQPGVSKIAVHGAITQRLAPRGEILITRSSPRKSIRVDLISEMEMKADVVDDIPELVEDDAAKMIISVDASTVINHLNARIDTLEVMIRKLDSRLDAAVPKPWVGASPDTPNTILSPRRPSYSAPVPSNCAIPRVKNKDLQDLLDLCHQQGASLKRTKGGHIKVKFPGYRVVIIPSTPSDHRAVLNAKADLRKAGLSM